LQSKRSASPAVSRPDKPALNAQADTTSPNYRAGMFNAGMIIAPRGDMIMKSRMTAN